MPPSSRGRGVRARVSLLLVLPLVPGCGPEGSADSPEGAGAAPPRWSFAEPPLVEIGVVEGEEGYELDGARSAVLLSDGRIVVLNAGSSELRFFSPDGRHLLSVGREGEGPGELAYPLRVWRGEGDTLRVYEGGSSRFSLFDPEGAFLRTEPARFAESSDGPAPDPFHLDLWVHGWNWIDSPLPPEERGGVVAALARLPAPDTAAGVRYVRVTPDGLLWVTTPVPPHDRPSSWRVHHPDGRLLATLEMPARFEPLDLGEGRVLGRFRDELDVEFVRLYRVDGAPAAGPGLGALRGQGPATWPAMPEEVRLRLFEALRAVASYQEIGYSRSMTYRNDVASLEIPADRMPAGVRAQVMMADERGWAGVFLDAETGASCALAYGATVPAGWHPLGSALCPGSGR